MTAGVLARAALVTMTVVAMVAGVAGVSGPRTLEPRHRAELLVHQPAMEDLLEADRDLHQALVADRILSFGNPTTEQRDALELTRRENLQQAED